MQSLVSPIAKADEALNLELTRKPPPPKRYWAVRLFFASLLACVATIGLLVLHLGTEELVGGIGFGTAAVLAIAGAAFAIVALTHFPRLRGAQIALLVATLMANGVMAFVGAALAVFSTMDFGRGRQIRRGGRLLLPPLERGDAWASARDAVRLPDDLCDALAHQWRENGRTEHASVAAFARHTLDLMAVGAPPSLVHSAQRDALDEIRHAQLCFSLARAIDGREVGPGSFAVGEGGSSSAEPRSLLLARLAVSSLVDGALHEGVSARVIAQLAKRTAVPQIHAVLKELAADEGRHAAHGWDVVEWCVQQGGRPVIDALVGAVGALPGTMRSPLPAAAQNGGWERYGIHGHALEAMEYEKAKRDIARRVEDLARVEAAA